MPIPKQIQNEFFIPDINSSYLNDDFNAVIIDNEPLEDFSFPSFFIRYNMSNSTSLNDLIKREWNFLINEKFITDAMKVFSKTFKNYCIMLSQNFNIKSDQFKDYITEFAQNQANQNILSLTYNFYLEIPSNNNIQNLLGPEFANDLQKNILNYYNEMLYNQLRKKLFKQFKEFKIRQSNIEHKLNYQMKMKIKVRNHFISQYQNRKIIYL